MGQSKFTEPQIVSILKRLYSSPLRQETILPHEPEDPQFGRANPLCPQPCPDLARPPALAGCVR